MRPERPTHLSLSLSPLKGGEGDASGTDLFSLSAPGGGEGRGEVGAVCAFTAGAPPVRVRPRTALLFAGDDWHRADEAPCVSLLGRREQGLGDADLDEPPLLEHRDAIGEVAHHREVVGDEEVGEAAPRPQFLQQPEDAGLHQHVERGCGLVEDHQLRAAGQRTGDRDALPLPAGERCGVTPREFPGQAHFFEERRHDLRPFPPFADAVHIEGEAERGADGALRVEGGKRVLLHELDGAPVLAPAPGGQGGAVHQDCARCRRIDAKDEVGDGGLACAGLAHDGKALADPDIERHIDEGGDLAIFESEHLGETQHLEDRRAHGAPPPASCTTRGWEKSRGSSSMSGSPPPVMRGTAAMSARV